MDTYVELYQVSYTIKCTRMMSILNLSHTQVNTLKSQFVLKLYSQSKADVSG